MLFTPPPPCHKLSHLLGPPPPRAWRTLWTAPTWKMLFYHSSFSFNNVICIFLRGEKSGWEMSYKLIYSSDLNDSFSNEQNRLAQIVVTRMPKNRNITPIFKLQCCFKISTNLVFFHWLQQTWSSLQTLHPCDWGCLGMEKSDVGWVSLLPIPNH